MNILKSIVFLFTIVAVYGSPLPKDCGHSLNGSAVDWRVVGGKDAAVGEFPWFSLLAVQFNNRSIFQDTCGGSIINDRWILTAAHCLPMMPIKTFEVKLGVHNMSVHEKSEVDIVIEKYLAHPHWDPSNILNDIALLKLNESLDFKGRHKQLRPICLAKSDTKLTNKCVTYGFGSTNGTRSQPPIDGILQKLDTSVADQEQCKKKGKKLYHESTEICIISGPKGGHLICDGDSGGPIQCRGEDGRAYQVGIVSYGDSNCEAPYGLAVYSKVSAYVDWIEKTIESN